MSIFYLALTAIIAGILGGAINFFLPAISTNPGDTTVTENVTKSIIKCIVLGIGATLLVPIFLELAKSKILDDVTFKQDTCNAAGICTKSLKITSIVDSSKKVVKIDTAYLQVFGVKIHITKDLKSGKVVDSLTKIMTKPNDKITATGKDVPKNYLLWFSYCMVASIAGIKFINMLVGKVVPAAEVRTLRAKLERIEQEQIKSNNKS